MTLRDYMTNNKITCAAMAKDLDCHDVYLSSIKTGRRKPGLSLALRIELLTGGEVSVSELRGPRQ